MSGHACCQHNSSICIFKESKEECDGSNTAEDGHEGNNTSSTGGNVALMQL